MASLDNQFNVEKAKNWKRDVEAEFNEVNVLLQQVATECESDPVEDDTIMQAIVKTGEAMQQTWTELGKQFQATINGLQKIADTWQKVISEGVDRVNEFKAKFGL